MRPMPENLHALEIEANNLGLFGNDRVERAKTPRGKLCQVNFNYKMIIL